MELDNLEQGKAVEQAEDDGVVIHVRDVRGVKMTYTVKEGDGENAKDVEKPVTMRVAGTYSKRFRRITDMNRDKMMRRRGSMLDGDAVNRQAVEAMAECIIEWDGFFVKGRPLTLSKNNAVVLLEACPWIKTQVDEAMNDHAAFFKDA
jgi:hypothetical protein